MALILRPITAEEFEAQQQALWEDYAADRARNLGNTIEEERAESARQRAELLPQGLATPEHDFWHAVTPEGQVVGALWVHVNPAKRRGFIYDIEVVEAERGKGYGRQMLDALEAHLKARGVTKVELNVFGDNTVARRLYERAGYQPVATLMRKEI